MGGESGGSGESLAGIEDLSHTDLHFPTHCRLPSPRFVTARISPSLLCSMLQKESEICEEEKSEGVA